MIQQEQLTAQVLKIQFGQRLDRAIAKLFVEFSRAQIKEWIIKRRVSINGIIVDKPDRKLSGEEHILINIKTKKNQVCKAQNISLNIVYEDEDILVINKPSNLIVHPGSGHPDSTVLNALLYYYPEIANIPRAGIIHRLDKDTTGLMVIAKTICAQNNLVKKLQLHEIIREYEAVVFGRMISGGTVNASISRHLIKRTRMTVNPIGKPAITIYRIIDRFRSHTHLRVRIKTGRTHQIRVHMAYINHPLVGDLYYGGRSRLPKGSTDALNKTLRDFKRQALHAIALRLCHPITGIEMEWHAPLPTDMVNLISELKIDMDQFSNL